MRTGRFVVEIDDVEVAGWRSVAIPSRSTEQDEYREDDDPTELDAGADGDVATESITVAYDKMDRVEQ